MMNYEVPDNPALIEIALWYHDAVYQPKRQDNEKQSARWCEQFLTRQAVAKPERDTVVEHIMATCHDGVPSNRDQALVIDIDLSILGADRARFDEYETQVRKEYRWVPWLLYKRKRKAILQYFLQQPRIYHTPLFFDALEASARQNLIESVNKFS